MKPQDVIGHFGTQEAAAQQISEKDPGWPVTQRAISSWLNNGAVPPGRQYQIERITGGSLRAQVSTAEA